MSLPLHHRVTGQGAPLILLHGLFGSLENLGGLAQRLADSWQVHALDLRNHGRSPHSDTFTYAAMAADVLAYMDAQGLSQASLVGHSMGGKTAMTLALQAPQRVGRLVVLDIAPVTYPPHHDAILEGLAALNPAALASRDAADQQLRAWVPETAVRQFLLKNLQRAGTGGFAWRLNLPVIARCYAEILKGQHGTHRFDGPVLFVKGGDSAYLQARHQAEVMALFPQAQMKVVPGTGHWLHAEKPDLVATVVRRFLASP
ncbi:MAG: alpha/beta fold hydrolase [Gammaproteobacteria bacterium]|nr:alpha/beta fold hydrolase [Gammaproteobacteria bacterium]